MSERTRLGEALWPRDGRTTAEIDDGIREELEAHIEQLVDEQIRAGVPEDEARRRAVAQFGDVKRYAAQCRRIDLGDRLLVRRALVAACAGLLAACAYLGWRVWQSEQTAAQLRRELAVAAAKAADAPKSAEAPVSADAPDSKAAWVKRVLALREHMQTAFSLGPELTLLPPDEGLAIVREAWPQILIAEVKTGLLKAFAFGKALAPKKHPRILQVLHQGMTDKDPEVRKYAASYLQEFAREDLNDNQGRYQAWYRKYGELPIEEVLKRTQTEVPESLRQLLAEMDEQFRKGDVRDAASVAGQIGETGHPYAIPTLIGVIDADNSYDTVYGVGYFGLSRITGVDYSPYHDGAWWRRWWDEHKGDYPREIQELAIPEYAKTAHGAAHKPYPADMDTLAGKLRHFAAGGVAERTDIWSWAQQVAKHNDPAAIPFLIGVIDADNTYDTVYGVGSFGLGRITGVRYDSEHDGAWWRAWWNDNKGKYPTAVQALEIPDLRKPSEDQP